MGDRCHCWRLDLLLHYKTPAPRPGSLRQPWPGRVARPCRVSLLCPPDPVPAQWLSKVKRILRDKATGKQALRSLPPPPLPDPSRIPGASSPGRGGLPLAHAQPTQTHTYVHACELTQAHLHAHVHTQTHICQARRPPHTEICRPLPLTYAWPPGDGPPSGPL